MRSVCRPPEQPPDQKGAAEREQRRHRRRGAAQTKLARRPERRDDGRSQARHALHHPLKRRQAGEPFAPALGAEQDRARRHGGRSDEARGDQRLQRPGGDERDRRHDRRLWLDDRGEREERAGQPRAAFQFQRRQHQEAAGEHDRLAGAGGDDDRRQAYRHRNGGRAMAVGEPPAGEQEGAERDD